MTEPATDDGDAPTPGGYEWTPDVLRTARVSRRQRWALLLAATVLGVGLAWLHWVGLVVAGVLVGIVSRTVPRAVGAGVAVGVLILAVAVLASPSMGAGELLGLAPLSYVTVGVALVGAVWGSLVRAVV
jgi:hypothetical protein